MLYFATMSRWKASLIHFSLSLLVAAVAVGLLLGVWYPPPYFQAGGADRLLLLVVGVDVILGPLLTLVVFDTRKPELKRDLAIIVAVQLLALGYGFHVMLQSRPAFLVAAVDRFVVVAANDLDRQDLEAAGDPRWRSLSWAGPELVATQRPESAEERNALLLSGLDGKDIERLPRYYVEYAHEAPNLLARAHPLSRLRTMNPDDAGKIDAWLKRNNRAEESVVWLPIIARMDDITMLLDKETGEPLGAIALAPW